MSFDFDNYCQENSDFNDAMNGMYKEETSSIFEEINKDMEEFFNHIDGIIHKDPEEVDVITDHLPEPKCGMDELVEKFEALDYLVGSDAEEEAEYWESKAEVHFGI